MEYNIRVIPISGESFVVYPPAHVEKWGAVECQTYAHNTAPDEVTDRAVILIRRRRGPHSQWVMWRAYHIIDGVAVRITG